MAWLRNLLDRYFGKPLPFPFPPRAAISEGEWRTAVEVTRISAYQIGLAEGELRGRLALAREIEAAFGPEGQEITAADAIRIRLSQMH